MTVTERLTEADVAVVFADNAASARTAFDRHLTDLMTCPTVWVAYPKGNRTDINRDTLHLLLVDYGLRPVAQVAIDETWSALRFRPRSASNQ
ncbi:hypothetical protein ACWIGW_41480 [Nocardia brasiliensis]